MRFLLLFSGILSVGLSAYFSALPLGGVSQKDISDMYQTFITPATYTFSIWGVIYLSWIVLGVYQLFTKYTPKTSNLFLFAATQITSSLWLIPWHYNNILLSFIVMLEIFGILLFLVIRREIASVFQSVVDLFFGWIVIACIANFHIFLVSEGLYGQGMILGVLSIFVGLSLSYYMYKNHATIIPTGVLLWSLIGISLNQENIFILISCIGGIVFTLVTIIKYIVLITQKPLKN